MSTQIRLTQTVQKGGCAAKVAAAELRSILSRVSFPPRDPRVTVDGGLFDDAAIFAVDAERSLVQTLDFFTPIVDTPSRFGKIAAANALSDVYAMGGEPATAMAILAFPLATLDTSVAVDVLQGACEALTEAQTSLVGGHSIDDDNLKFGLSVTGFVHPERVWTNAGARAGDVLILTKALGTGTLTAGLKRGAWGEGDIEEALSSMAQVNRVLDLLGEDAGAIHAATDVTGFGLAGHSMQMAKASGVHFEFRWEDLPRFAKTQASLAEGFLTKAHRTNREYVREQVDATGFDDLRWALLTDPQTSGGLLLSVAPEAASSIMRRLSPRFQNARIIGEVRERRADAWWSCR